MLGLSKPPGERERAKPFRILIVPGGVYAGGGTVFASGNPISQSKNRFLAIFACVAQRREQKLERVVVAGEILPRPPSCQKYFLTRWAFLIHKGMGECFFLRIGIHTKNAWTAMKCRYWTPFRATDIIKMVGCLYELHSPWAWPLKTGKERSG